MVSPISGMKRCTLCAQLKPLSAFHRMRSAGDGHRPSCKVCRHRREYLPNREVQIERAQRWAAAHPEIARRRAREWQRRNRRYRSMYEALKRIEKRGVVMLPFTFDRFLQRMAYYGDRCWICRGAAEAVDHVKPLKARGPHMLSNLRPICTSCNSKKGITWPLVHIEIGARAS